jgi:two-component system OmpR family response regulator/two-component system response regulator QseB
MRLLLAEDDQLLGDGVYVSLTEAGYATDWVKDGSTADLALQTENYDLLVLDLGLPRLSGQEILKALRQRGNDIPVLILTARDTVSDRVRGLDHGADDYLVKPFDMDELQARVRALLRRSGGRSNPLLQHEDLSVDPAAHVVTRHGAAVDVSPREFAVLQMLLENRGKVMSRARLEEGLYSWGDEVESNAVEVYIHHLRRKLGPQLIRTIRGVGYTIDKTQ